MQTDDNETGGNSTGHDIRWGLALLLLSLALYPVNALIEAVVPAFLPPTENTLLDDLPQLAFNVMLMVLAVVGLGKIVVANLTSGRAHSWPLVEDIKAVLGLHAKEPVAELPVPRADLLQESSVWAIYDNDPALMGDSNPDLQEVPSGPRVKATMGRRTA